ncbi:MAG: lysylphosphatidylglycerol synthase transmembrane domain-containing protein, partial [Candidatus Kapaibacterium sp.]
MKYLQSTIVKVAVTLLVFCVGLGTVLWLADVDVRVLVERFLDTRYGLALLSIPIVILSHFVRAWRWQTLLGPIRSEPVSMFNLFSAVMVGYAANNILPRSGEVLRPFVLHRREELGLSGCVASVLVERFIDVVNLLLFLALAMFVIGDRLQHVLPSADLPRIVNSIAISSLLLLIVLVVFAATTVVESILRVLISPLTKSGWSTVENALASFKSGLRIIQRPREYPVLLFQSFLIWLLYILPVYVMCKAYPAEVLQSRSFLDACIILLVMAIATTLTPPVPGGFIVIPAMLAGALIPLFGCSREDAAAYAFLTFMLNYVPVTVIGGLFMLREQVRPG